MAEGINKAYLIGNLGADAELRKYPKATVLKFRLATTERWKGADGEKKERTDWHRCSLWGERGEKLSAHLTKGTTVFVEGRIEHDSYEKEGQTKYTTEIHVRDLKFISPSKRDGTRDGIDLNQVMDGRVSPPPYPGGVSANANA